MEPTDAKKTGPAAANGAQQRNQLRETELLLDVSRKMAEFDTLDEVLRHALVGKKKEGLMNKLAAYLPQNLGAERPAVH